MARGDTAPPRRHFTGSDLEPIDAGPKRLRYPCLAHGCPMPGSIFLNGHDAPGICALHMGCNSSDFPRVTEVLRNWSCVTFALETCRQFLTNPDHCTDIKAEKTLMAAQWTELQRMAPDWDQLKPLARATLSDWARQLTAFLVWRVGCDAHGRDTPWQWPPAPSHTVRTMLAEVKGQIGNAGAAL